MQTKVEQSNSGSDYVPNLTALAAEKHHNWIIAVGFHMDSAVKQVAQEFPNTTFAIVDDLPSPIRRFVHGLLFKDRSPATTPATWPA